MRRTILLTLLALSASAHATNIQYDLSWVLTNQSGLGYLVIIGFAAMLVLRRRNGAVSLARTQPGILPGTLDRRRIA
ncbi:MAG: hypothetical protein E2O54_09120 [Gammaproteobacteria bacterium]|nr:MAG: hypothetical protein E2O54_09120 [Gammaproteobacteria bacterium]